jgi:DNA-binding CsgD family transcriptional regulator
MTSTEDRSILLAAAAEVSWMTGDLRRSVELGARAVELGPGWFGITAGAAAAAALSRFELGEPVQAGIEPPKAPIFATFQQEIDALRAWSDGDPAGALVRLDEAAAAWTRGGPRRYATRALCTAGVIAGRVGHPSARRRLEAAERAARTAGLVPIARRAATARAAFQVSTLTARELDAVRLVADGRTSKQIAEQLAIAPSTVESHIAAAVRKLGARNRRHAASMLGPTP